mgnify:CR=1 FL=1
MRAEERGEPAGELESRGREVFLRMMDREGRKISPGEFLQTAIEHGVAAKIDRWVILQSIKMLSTHRSKGHNTRLTINLTANSVADPEFLQWLGVAIKAARDKAAAIGPYALALQCDVTDAASVAAAFDAVTASSIPADEDAWQTDVLSPAITEWYSYDFVTHQVSERAGDAGLKWSLAWLVWLQDLMLTYGFFA